MGNSGSRVFHGFQAHALGLERVLEVVNMLSYYMVPMARYPNPLERLLARDGETTP